MKSIFTGLALGIGAVPLAFGAGHAAALKPTAITVVSPAGSNDTTNPYTDDVYLQSLTFGDTTFGSESSFRAVSRFEVLTGRSEINSEWGDTDNGSDGDDNPFVKAGLNPADQESTNPLIQDAALLETFNTLSLSEMSDGEGGSAYSFRVEFAASLIDNDAGVDDVPEIVLFERGLNDIFTVTLITGGTFAAPIYSDSLLVRSNTFWKTGIFVDTTEIAASQEIGVGGFDLNDFGIDDGTAVYGMEISVATTGPDLNGFFLSAEDPGAFGAPLSAVPLPAGLPLLMTAIGGLAVLRKRRG